MDLRRNDGIERSLWERCLCLESDFCLTQGRFWLKFWEIGFSFNIILGSGLKAPFLFFFKLKVFFFVFVVFLSIHLSCAFFFLIGPRVGGLDLFQTTCTALPSLHSPNPPSYHFSHSSFRPLPHPLILSCPVLTDIWRGWEGSAG